MAKTEDKVYGAPYDDLQTTQVSENRDNLILSDQQRDPGESLLDLFGEQAAAGNSVADETFKVRVRHFGDGNWWVEYKATIDAPERRKYQAVMLAGQKQATDVSKFRTDLAMRALLTYQCRGLWHGVDAEHLRQLEDEDGRPVTFNSSYMFAKFKVDDAEDVVRAMLGDVQVESHVNAVNRISAQLAEVRDIVDPTVD